MPGEQPYLPEPGADEKSIIEEMLRNRGSQHWEKCRDFVRLLVRTKANNISRDDQEDIIQEVMWKVVRYLPSFRFQCSFRTWLNLIIERCIIDKRRKDKHNRFLNEEQSSFSSTDLSDDKEHKSEDFWGIGEKSAEEAFAISDEIHNGVRALLEYALTHSNSTRNHLIIQMVIFEGHTQIEAARKVGCDVGVVGYVVREAQRYAREKTERTP